LGVPGDNDGVGAGFVFERSLGQWSEQAKLLPSLGDRSGYSVALAGDGRTAILGSPGTNDDVGARFVFVRRFGVWKQEAELIGTGYDRSICVARIGGRAFSRWKHRCRRRVNDDTGNDGPVGAAWVFGRVHGEWRQEAKLVGTGFTNPPSQGEAVAIAADGNTVVVGGPADNGEVGAAWVFTRSYGAWSQQGPKLVGSNVIGGAALQGQRNAVALSGDGDTAVIGGFADDGDIGAAWVFTRDRGVWSEKAKLVGTGVVGDTTPEQGYSVAISGDGRTILSGAPFDGDGIGAAWVFGSQLRVRLAGEQGRSLAE
jgi:hypothetical protein